MMFFVKAALIQSRRILTAVMLFVVVIAHAQTNPPVYSYTVPIGGYALNGNLTNYTDTVTGTWSMGYDNLNRLTSGSLALPGQTQPSSFQCWTYDSFGNRTGQFISNQSFQSGSTPCQPASGASVNNIQTPVNGNNQVTSFTLSTPSGSADTYPVQYLGGNVVEDRRFQYAYDGEDRLCAVNDKVLSQITQYLYDAEGNRVAKGKPSSGNTLACPNGSNFTATTTYVIGPSGEQLSEISASNGNTWQHSNVYANGQLLATYDAQGVHFDLADPLGTKRVQVSGTGSVELNWSNMPFGDQMTSSGTGTDATEHHFTGKERDIETARVTGSEDGLDYFGARYYNSNMGRWMSPDPAGFVYADQNDPQTLNLYSYVRNNPLTLIDPLGLYSCDPDTTTTSTDIEGNINETVTAGHCRFDSEILPSKPLQSTISQQQPPQLKVFQHAPNNSFLHKAVCFLASPLLGAASAANGTVGVGAGGSVGVLAFFGGSLAAGVQAVADPSGNLGVAINVNPGFVGFGASAMGGGQVSVSTSKSIFGLGGWSLSGDISAGSGPAGDLGVSRGFASWLGPTQWGATTVTATVGPGIGTRAAVGSVGSSFVPQSLSTNCGKK